MAVKSNKINVKKLDPLLSRWINPIYLDKKYFINLKKQYSNSLPYRHLEVSDFFNHEKIVSVLKALITEKFYFKESDLFKFHQTQDLKGTNNKIIKEFIAFLYSPVFINYMQNLTEIKFSSTVDIAGTMYEDTNFLLCHDDQLDKRKIAFLCYMSTVTKSDGGSLILYSHKKKLPDKIVKKIYPAFNKLAFFEVSDISFHEVEEIYSPTAKRMAIGGWYYGK